MVYKMAGEEDEENFIDGGVGVKFWDVSTSAW